MPELMTVSIDEKACVRAARNGDEDAFAVLVKLHWNRLVLLARSIIGQLNAEDVVQDSFITGWQKLNMLQNDNAFQPWMTKIVVRHCYKVARWNRVRSLLSFKPTMSVEQGVDASIDMHRALLCLTPQQRAVMHCTVIEGQTDSEIAQLLNMKKGTVRAHRRRARERLQKIFGEEL